MDNYLYKIYLSLILLSDLSRVIINSVKLYNKTISTPIVV